MFNGSLRFNLDPTGKVSDEKMIKLLKEAGLENLLNRKVTKQKEDKEQEKTEEKDEKEEEKS